MERERDAEEPARRQWQQSPNLFASKKVVEQRDHSCGHLLCEPMLDFILTVRYAQFRIHEIFPLAINQFHYDSLNNCIYPSWCVVSRFGLRERREKQRAGRDPGGSRTAGSKRHKTDTEPVEESILVPIALRKPPRCQILIA